MSPLPRSFGHSFGRLAAVGAVATGGLALAAASVRDDGPSLASSASRAHATPTSSSPARGLTVIDVGEEPAEANAVVATDDGGAYVVGAIGSTDDASARRDVLLARIGPDGALDASFGTAGLVTTDFGGEDEAEAVEQLPDGRLLVVGTSDRTDQLETDVLVARYHPDGRPDDSLGGDGGAMLTAEALRTDCARASSVAADSHGRILVAGGLGCGGEGGEGLRGLLTRLRPDGRLDRSFNRLGLDHVCSVDDMAVRRNDRIVLIGDQTSAGQNDAYCEQDITGTVLGLRANGELDRTFGVRAQTKLRIPGTVGNTAHAVHVDRRERVLVAVGANISQDESRPAVVRLNARGQLDRSFGRGGHTTLPQTQYQHTWPTGLTVDGRGRIVGVAQSYDADQRSSRFVVFRLRAQGQPDRRFGSDGTTTLDFGSEAEGNAIAPVPANNGAVAVGEAYPACPPSQCVNDRAIAVAQVR